MPQTIIGGPAADGPAAVRVGMRGIHTRGAFEHHLGLQLAAGHFEPGQAIALRIMRHLVYASAEIIRVLRFLRIAFEARDEFLDALHLQRGAEEAREDLTSHDHLAHGVFGHGSGFQVFVHGGFALHGDFLHAGRRVGEIDAAIGKTLLELGEQPCLVGARGIHFVDEKKRGDPVSFQ